MNGQSFVLGIILISTVGWLINNWIRARHGYALENEWSGKTEPPSDAAKALADENRELREQLGLVGERIKVLERIVTDKGYTVASEIEALREPRAAAALPASRAKEVQQ